MARLQGVVVAAVAAVVVLVLLVMQARLNAMNQQLNKLKVTVDFSQQGAAPPRDVPAVPAAPGAAHPPDRELLTKMSALEGAVQRLQRSVDTMDRLVKAEVNHHEQNRRGEDPAVGGKDQSQPQEGEQQQQAQPVDDHEPRRLCIAVPSAARPGVPDATVLKRLQELHDEIDPEKDVVVLRQSHSSRDNERQRDYARQLGFAVEVDETGWPELARPDIKRTLDDPIDRVRWRAAQVGDFAMALKRCSEFNVHYVLLLEDDATPAHRFTEKLFQRLQGLPTQDFGYVTLYSGLDPPPQPPWREITALDREGWFHGGDGRHGAVALLMHRRHVPELAAFLLENKLERPVDWLIPGYFGGDLALRNFELIPNLAQHLSKHSTLKSNKHREKWKSHSFVYDDEDAPAKDNQPAV